MKKIKLASSETKTVNEVFGVEQYAVVGLSREISEDRETILYYKPRIYSIHETKEDAIKCIQDNNDYGAFVVPMTEIIKEQYNVWNRYPVMKNKYNKYQQLTKGN